MARIEISLEEYNSLKSKITTLEKILENKNATIEKLNAKVEEHDEDMEFIKDSTIFDRLFRWSKIISLFNKS